MDPEIRKKLIVPFVVLLAILAINVNSIISGINHRNTSRVVIAIISTAIISVCFMIVYRGATKGGNKE